MGTMISSESGAAGVKSGQPRRAPEVVGPRAEKLLKVTAAIAEAISTDQVFEALVDRVAEAIDASSAGLWLVQPDENVARLARARGYSDGARAQVESLALDAKLSIPAIDSLRLAEPLWFASQGVLLAKYPHLQGVATAGRTYRVACLPLMAAHGRVLGTLGLTIEEACEWSHEEKELLLLIARYASQAIERLQLFDEEKRSRAEAFVVAQRLKLLNRASRVFNDSELDLAARLRCVAFEVATALSSCVNLSLLEADGRVHLTAVHHPIAEAHEALLKLSSEASLRVGEGVTGGIVATGKSVLLPSMEPNEVRADAPVAYREFMERFPAYALMGVPLTVRGRIIGALTATRFRAGESYTNEDLALLDELSERAAVAIENGRLYEEAATARVRAEQLYRFAQTAVAADRIELVFEAALDAIESALNTQRAAILTFDEEGKMRFRAFRRLSESYRSAVEGHSPWPRDARDPAAVLVADPAQDPAMAPYLSLFAREGIGAVAFVPLVTSGVLLGKFMVYYDKPHVFLAPELETAQSIANHLASVISRMTAVSELQETIRNNELFAGVLAHDLRNPLSAMMMAAQLLLTRHAENDVVTQGRTAKPLTRILSSGQRMKRMIEQLLDFTRARSGGGIGIEPVEVGLLELTTQAIDEVLLAQPEWQFRSRAVGDLRGSWDPDRLLQVLSNLLSNAGQHGSPGREIVVSLDGLQKESVTIEVHNEGVVPEALLPQLFDPFRSTRRHGTSAGGLGLGLFIVREIARAHGGTVHVTSTEAEGTTFRVRLPRRSARPTP